MPPTPKLHVSVYKTFTFSAAHSLPEHDGKCRRLHGHTYRVEIGVTGDLQTSGPSNGMVIDFGDMTSAYSELVHARFDHDYLNDKLPQAFMPPTAEKVALFIWDVLYERFLPTSCELTCVRVWETDTCYAEVRKW